MKRNILLVLALLNFSYVAVKADVPYPNFRELFVGEVEMSSISLTESGDTLKLDMEITIKADALNRRQSWTIIPAMKTGDDQQEFFFPRILINGKIKHKHFRRMERYGDYGLFYHMPEYYSHITTDGHKVFRYYMEVPYEHWMDTAYLSINQILTSSAKKRQLFKIENAGMVDLTAPEAYIPELKVDYILPEKEEKRRKMQGQAYLDFQVGRSVIIPGFRRNPEELAKINAAIEQVINDPDVQITGMFIEGYASPEASYSLNERLARERSNALRDYIIKNYPLTPDMFQVNSVPEDWEGLVAQLQESNIEPKDRIMEIINTEPDPDRREQKLKALGAPWRRMLTEIFPSLRRVEYQIDFTVKDFTLEEADIIAKKNPELLSQRELYLLAEKYADDPVRREEIFEIMLHNYPRETVAIINASAMYLDRDELNSAKRYLDRTEDPRALNNKGVYALKAGDIEQAEQYLNAAAASGNESAKHNLEQLEIVKKDIKIQERYERSKQARKQN